MLMWPVLLAQVAKAKGKTKGPPQEGFWAYMDRANEFVSNPNFEAAIRSPWFWGISIVAIALALFRGWKAFLIGYIGIVAMWGVVHFTVLKDRTAAGGNDQSVLVFAALTVGVAGLGIYFMLIRD